MIVLVTGLKGSGKDTVGEWLHNQYGYKKMSFANPLKDVVSTMFGWERSKLEGENINDRVWRETIDEHWSQLLGRKITPRLILQEIGTDVIRKGFNDDFWIFSAMSQLNTQDDFCFTDVRFPNEIIKIKKTFPNVITLNIVRSPLPDWYGDIDKAIQQNIHESEYTMSLHPELIDYTVTNDSDIVTMCKTVDFILDEQQRQINNKLIQINFPKSYNYHD